MLRVGIRGMRCPCLHLEDSVVARRLGSSSLEDRVELLEAVGPAAAMQFQSLLGGEVSLSQCHGRPPVEEVQ